MAASEHSLERAAVVDFFSRSEVAHWFWPAAEAILATSPDIHSTTLRLFQEDAPPVHLAQIAKRLESRFLGMNTRKVLLWTKIPTPTLITARFIGEVLEALWTASDGSGLSTLDWLAAAAESATWLDRWIPWLADQVPGADQATALAPILSRSSSPPAPAYIYQGIEESEKGTIRFGGHILRDVADLRTAVGKSIASAKARRRAGFEVPRPLGWIHRLLAAHPPWRPLVDVALRQLVAREDGDVVWIIEWALDFHGHQVHTPKTITALKAIALPDADFIAEAFDASTEHESNHREGVIASRSLQPRDAKSARALVQTALYDPNRRPYLTGLKELLGSDATWLGQDAGVAGLPICLSDLAAQLLDEARLQEVQAPKVASAARW